MRHSVRVRIAQARLLAIGALDPAEEMVEAAILHRHHDDVLDAGLRRRRQCDRAREFDRTVHQFGHTHRQGTRSRNRLWNRAASAHNRSQSRTADCVQKRPPVPTHEHTSAGIASQKDFTRINARGTFVQNGTKAARETSAPSPVHVPRPLCGMLCLMRLIGTAILSSLALLASAQPAALPDGLYAEIKTA